MAIPASTRTQAQAIADGELRTEVIRTAFEDKLRSSLKLVGMCNRTFEEQMRQANSVRYYEDRTTLSVVDAALPTSGTTAVHTWRTSGRNTQTLAAKHLVWERDLAIDMDIPIQDIAELSVPLLVQGADDRARRVAVTLDSYVLNRWKAIALGAVPQGLNVEDSSEATEDQTTDYGTTSNYIDTTGTENGTLKLLPLLKALKLKLKQGNKVGDVAESPEDVWQAAMPPHLFTAIETELAALSNTDGTLVTAILAGVERKLLYGIFEIEETNSLVSETVSSKAYYPIYVSTPRATTFGDRLSVEQEFTPGNNPLGPYYKYDAYFQYYVAVQDPRFLYEMRIRSET